jgi:hypothetical protein
LDSRLVQDIRGTDASSGAGLLNKVWDFKMEESVSDISSPFVLGRVLARNHETHVPGPAWQGQKMQKNTTKTLQPYVGHRKKYKDLVRLCFSSHNLVARPPCSAASSLSL